MKLNLFKTKTTQRKHLFFFALSLLTQTALAQLVAIPVTGFNNDIVANGVGANSIPGTTFPSIGMDGARYTFIDNTYKYVSTNALPTCFMPVSNTAASLRTPGLTYTFQSYTGFNALTIDNDNTAYLTSPFAKTGSLTLASPASYSKLFVLYESVMYISPMTVNVVVTFTDATTQVFNGNSCVNWFTATLPAFNNVGRTMPTGVIQCGGTPNFFPNMFELLLTINATNYTKLVQSIEFTLPAVYTTGTTADKVNYFHAMAVGGQVAPLALTEELESTTAVLVYPNPAADYLSIQAQHFSNNSWFVLSDISGREVLKTELQSSAQLISVAAINKGIYFYKVIRDLEIIKTGKVMIDKE